MKTEAYTPYKDRKLFVLRRQKRELMRSAVDVETLDKVFKGLTDNYQYRENKQLSNLSRWGKDPSRVASSKQLLMHFAYCKATLTKLYNRIRRPLLGIIETRNRLFKDCSPEERAERTQALLRIPPTEFVRFDKLSLEEQEAELLRLIEVYGQGSKNGGFSPTLLNMPGLLNPHTIGSYRESDGSKRRSLFQWQLIDRLIYAAMHPDKYQHLFFHKTAHVVQRWGKNVRQMRSEGRFAMTKVLIVLVTRLDWKYSLRAGVYNPETKNFMGLSRADIAKAAGISVHAVKEALSNLVALNILHRGKQPREAYQETAYDENILYKGLPVVRKFKPLLVAALSLEDLYRSSKLEAQPDATLSPEDQNKLRELELEGEELGIDVTLEVERAKVFALARAIL
jgi:hypothetical protein